MKIILAMILSMSIVFGTVDINKASAKELQVLKGIGIKKASAIISYRKDNCFKSIYELSNVKGISTKTMNKNIGNLEVSKCGNGNFNSQ